MSFGSAGGRIIQIGQWPEARRGLKTPAYRKMLRTFVVREAHAMQQAIVDGIKNQAPGGLGGFGGAPFDPLAENTIRKRRLRGFRGTKALIERGELRRSFIVRTFSSGGMTSAFVGVLKTARSSSGAMLANVAAIAEYGSRPIVIRITPRMRRFLALLSDRKESKYSTRTKSTLRRTKGGGGSAPRFGPSKGFVVVQIPARPIFRPVIEASFQPADVEKRFRRHVGHFFDSIVKGNPDGGKE